MSKSPPSQDKTIFLICDDVRPEPGNKASYLGVLGSDRAVLNVPPGDNAVLPGLAFIFTFVDGEGTFKLKLGVIDPEGKNRMPEVGEGADLSKVPNVISTMIFKIAPFQATEGEYKVFVELDATRYERHFSIKKVAAAAAV